jgi:hypothetical protein
MRLTRERLDALCELEQRQLESRDRQQCIDCGEPGTIPQRSSLIASVHYYYRCDYCNDCEDGKSTPGSRRLDRLFLARYAGRVIAYRAAPRWRRGRSRRGS